MVHLQENGFDVDAIDVDNLQEVKHEHGITNQLASCHTALIDGYVIEGHVPASAIQRLLDEGGYAGLSVPGMPQGPPGMEGPNPQPWNVLAFDKDGNTTVYESH